MKWIALVVLAMASPSSTVSTANPVAPSPMAPKHPQKVTLTAGSFSCMRVLAPDGGGEGGACVRLWGLGGDVAYEVGSYLPDGGVVEQLFTDGGGFFNASADSNYLPLTSIDAPCLLNSQDGVCFFSFDAGAAYVAPRYP